MNNKNFNNSIDKKAKQKALKLFYHVYENCPAYQDFIKKSKISVKDIKTIDDFDKIPIIDKHNYIKKYPLEKRLYKNKTISDYYMVCSSSGSSGKPTIWLRDLQIDKKLEKAQKQMFENHFKISEQKTLCVITFGLGAWTAGMLSSKLSWPVAEKNKFSVVTPGLDKKSTLDFIKLLYPHYDQIIVMGYPPFLTDLIELARKKKFDLKKANLKLLYTSERVSERWRNHIANLLSENANRHNVVGFYACSDAGIIGDETKFSIDLLEKCEENTQLSQSLFSSDESPSLASYDPNKKYLESINNEVILTTDQPVPLIRYNIHDRGKLISGANIKKTIKKFSILQSEYNIIDNNYVYLFGKSDSVKITANIYAEDIKYCLDRSTYSSRLSGYFQYGREKTKGFRYRLKVAVYLNPKASLTKVQKNKFEKEFYQNLLKASIDFKVIQSGTKIEKFKFLYLEDDPTKYKTSKLQYFL